MVRRLRRVGALSAITALLLSIIAAPSVAIASAPAAAAVVNSAAPGQPGAPTFVRGVHRVPHSLALRSSGRLAAPTAIQISTADGHQSDLLANFDGVGSLDSKVTNFDAQFEPPDQGLCVGNGFVVEMVNSAFRIFDTKGNTLAGPTNVNEPFQDGFLQFTSDPRCVYDRSTNTWFAVILFLADDFLSSRLEIAFNTSGDPTTPWSVFKIDTTHTGGPGCPCFGDQPTLGMDGSNLYVTTNEFSINGPPFFFNGAQIYAIDKHDLVSGEEKVHFVQYGNLFIGGDQAFSVQPAMTYGSADAEYFLSSLDLNGIGDKRVGVWALTNVSAVGSGRRPTLSSFILASEAYSPPPAAIQKGSSSLLDSGDDRMQQTQFIDGEIWGALDTQVLPAGDTAPRAGAAWFRVKPHLRGSRIRSATMTAQGYVLSEGQYVIYPAIQADGEGHAAMVFTLTSATLFASAAYAVLTDEGESFGHPKIAAAGSGPYDPKATRWGDYSWALLDTASHSIWMATEYMPPLASQSPKRNWGTRVIQLSLDQQQQQQ
ncbi:MAG TPA: hypothetical protein VGU71_20750 [Candidatus Dormibacteraeota bacterium]|nr:hypothetical protein [Candidatus Dormibacteraeota bacterium]